MQESLSNLTHSSASPTPRARVRHGIGFAPVLVVVIVLAALAIVVLPQFTSAHQQDRENSLKDELRYLRTQVAVFKAQHRGIPPGYRNGNPSGAVDADIFFDQMSHHTDINCRQVLEDTRLFNYGPYLGEMPADPINGKRTILIVGNNQPIPLADGSTGWIYKPQTQEIVPNVPGSDAFGSSYAAY